MIERPKPVWNFQNFVNYLPPRGFIRDYVTYAVRCTDAHPLYHIISASAVVSAAIAPHMDLYHNDEAHPLHCFFLIVGLSSESRKTSAIKRAARVAEPVINIYSQTKNRIWWPQVSSPEGILEELAIEPNRLMCMSEWTDMHRLASKGGYWQHANEFWNNIYDAQDLHRVRAKAQTITVKRPRVTILGASTPSLIEDATSRVDWLAGKLARYIIAPAIRPAGFEMDAAADYPSDVEALRYQLDVLCRPNPLLTRMELSPEAWNEMRRWQKSDFWKDLQRRAPEHLQPCFGRAAEHVFRLSAIFEASATFPWRAHVSFECMDAAIRVIEWCYDAMCKTFSVLHDVDRSGITKVNSLLATEGAAGVTRAELLRKSKLPSKQLDDIIRTLMDRNEVKAQPFTGRNGRGTTRYFYTRPEEE